MRQIVLPGTDLSVSRLSFGTGSIHHLKCSADRQRLLAEAFERGFTHFDTAPYYGYGIGEKELGRFLSTGGKQATVATKVGLYPPMGQTQMTSIVWLRKALGRVIPRVSTPVINWSISRANRSLESSLRNLKRDCVDLLFLHEPDTKLIDADEFLSWIHQQRTAGKLKHWGLAGDSERFSHWIRREHALAHVIQARDSVEFAKDWTGLYGRVPQITFGYLSSQRGALDNDTVGKILSRALRLNQSGTVLTSTRKLDRMAVFSKLAVEPD